MAYIPIINKNSRPDQWITGPDLLTHLQYRAWVQQRNQAVWRGEGWSLTLQEFQHMWQDLWTQRGRTQAELMMTRPDATLPWQVDNCEIITRREHGQRQAARRVAGIRSRARSRELEQIAAATAATLPAAVASTDAAAESSTPRHPHDDATNHDKQPLACCNYGHSDTGAHNG